jgi:carboxypeptidase D
VKHNAEHGNVRSRIISNLLQHFKLKGLLIGNGWTDPANQYPAYVSYVYKAGLVKEGSEKAKPIEDQLAICRNVMKDGIHVSINECENILNTILQVTRDEYRLSR